MMMECNVYNPSYNFMRRSDPFHAFYKQKLNEYRSQVGDDDATDSEVDDAAEQPRTRPQFIELPDFLLFCNPPGMSLKELDTIKLTAHFVSWYGAAFWLGLAKRKIPELQFMDPDDSRFKCFSEFVGAYSKVLKPPAGLKQELRNSAAYTATIIDAFLQRLKWDPVQHYEWLQRGVKAMLDWHASVTKDLTNKDQNPQMQQSPPRIHKCSRIVLLILPPLLMLLVHV
ncbi:probable splicing factor 3A subunit 1 [Arabidopsis lyrata subsp. lyrata]|nr:probable splicing factor 3A subunit 1 [Arabidopsis lyrata subsp. lyrata]|eukprot:XP_020872183.1 probable splicing factor 3A subunit 1 [Arabidopsis lyrata subsp. lyrata]